MHEKQDKTCLLKKYEALNLIFFHILHCYIYFSNFGTMVVHGRLCSIESVRFTGHTFIYGLCLH